MSVSEELLDNIVRGAKRQYVAYLQHPVLGPELKAREPGGYLCITDYNGNVLRHVPVADYDDTADGMRKRERNKAFSLEKATRLARNPEHILSQQSRDPFHHQYGGAVRVKEAGIIISYSGDPEDVDTIKAIGLAVESKKMSREEMTDILNRFPNEYVTKIKEAAAKKAVEDLFLD
jgi:hypothetical protein